MIILQSPKVIATLTIMIITTTIIIIITTKIRAITTINSIDFTRISHHLVLHSKSAPATNVIIINIITFTTIFIITVVIVVITITNLFIDLYL